MFARVLLLAAVFLASLMSASGFAQGPRVLVAAAASDAPSALSEHATRVLEARLGEERFTVLRAEPSACDLACAVSMLAERGALMAVQLELWVPRGFRAQGAAIATLKDPTGSAVGRATFAAASEAAVASAVTSALDAALARWPSRAGVMVRIDGTPAGASVIVDHNPELGGVLPLDLALPAGPHVLSVTQYGYREEQRRFSVPEQAADLVPIHVSLVPLAAQHGGGASALERRLHWAHVAGPLALGLSGAAAVVVGTFGLVQDDPCARRSASGECVARERSNRGASLTYLGAGSAAVLAGAAWFTWAYVSVRRDRTEVGLRVPLGRPVALAK